MSTKDYITSRVHGYVHSNACECVYVQYICECVTREERERICTSECTCVCNSRGEKRLKRLPSHSCIMSGTKVSLMVCGAAQLQSTVLQCGVRIHDRAPSINYPIYGIANQPPTHPSVMWKSVKSRETAHSERIIAAAAGLLLPHFDAPGTFVRGAADSTHLD